MKNFAQLFTQLDQTTKTNTKVAALANYFKVATEKALNVSFLSQQPGTYDAWLFDKEAGSWINKGTNEAEEMIVDKETKFHKDVTIHPGGRLVIEAEAIMAGNDVICLPRDAVKAIEAIKKYVKLFALSPDV